MNAWASPTRRARRATRVFCFPYAGGGASLYRRIESFFPEEYEVVPVQLPGREERLRDAPHNSMEALVQSAANELQPLVRGRCVFLGYSLGALVAYEVARELSRRRRPIERLIVAAAESPTAFSGEVPESCEPDDEALINRLRGLGATPLGLLSSPEMMEVVLPAIRSDFRILESYQHEPGMRLQCPIEALAGQDDEDAPPSAMAAWAEVTTGPFQLNAMPGGHFFIHSSPRIFVESVLAALQSTRRRDLEGRAS